MAVQNHTIKIINGVPSLQKRTQKPLTLMDKNKRRTLELLYIFDFHGALVNFE